MNGKAYVSAKPVYDNQLRTNRTDFYEYDPATNQWALKTKIPEELGTSNSSGSIAFVHRNKWYHGFGWSPGIGAPFNFRSLWEFDPAIEKWTKKYEYTARPVENSFDLSAVYLNGTVYMLGRTRFTRFDVDQNTFSEGASFPLSLGSGASFLLTLLNGKIFVLTYDNFSSANISRLFEYDPAANKWTEQANGRAAMKYTTYRFSSLIPISGKLYAINAWGAAEYDPATNSWKKVIDNAQLNAVLDGQTYFISGNRAFLGKGTNWVEFKP